MREGLLFLIPLCLLTVSFDVTTINSCDKESIQKLADKTAKKWLGNKISEYGAYLDEDSCCYIISYSPRQLDTNSHMRDANDVVCIKISKETCKIVERKRIR